MVVTMEMDLSDPLSSSMSVDPLHIYSVTSSSSDEQDSPHRPSIQITRIGSNGNTNSAVLSVHKIPSYGNIQSNNGYSHNRMALSEPPKKRGRKKGSKNKFKRGIPIELWNKFASSGMIISKSENPLSLPYQSQPEVSEEVRVKRKYTKRPKIDIDIINEKLQDQIGMLHDF